MLAHPVLILATLNFACSEGQGAASAPQTWPGMKSMKTLQGFWQTQDKVCSGIEESKNNLCGAAPDRDA